MAAEEKNNTQIAEALGTTYSTVSIWRNRFYNNIDLIAQTEEYDGPDGDKKLSDVIKSVLSDKQRPGKAPVFTPEQIMLINELACKNPKDFGYELSCWNLASLAKEAVRQGIVGSISVASVQRFLKFAGIAPWKTVTGSTPRKSTITRNPLKKLKQSAASIFRLRNLPNAVRKYIPQMK